MEGVFDRDYASGILAWAAFDLDGVGVADLVLDRERVGVLDLHRVIVLDPVGVLDREAASLLRESVQDLDRRRRRCCCCCCWCHRFSALGTMGNFEFNRVRAAASKASPVGRV